MTGENALQLRGPGGVPFRGVLRAVGMLLLVCGAAVLWRAGRERRDHSELRTEAPDMTGENAPPTPEPDVVSVGGVLLVVGGIVLFLVGGVFGLALLFPGSTDVDPPPPRNFAGIALETRPVADYRDWRNHEAALLSGADGRLPISQAMAAVAARGAAAFDPLESAR